ncbi:hypothetical protein [Streptomyces sp. NBC_01233]|uniref:hypothetical protein n=1 Tax=Streptomyces sp. NBC_01233 TaxID=2903787 RepID=UPI002E160B6A|nr:hypothetical protein OG332_03860 [Streptomyces sp. NBC_01233]
MSDSVPPSEQPENAPEAGVRKRAALGRLVPRTKTARWMAAGAAVVVVGGGVAVAAVADHHHHGDRGPRIVRAEPGEKGGFKRGPEGAPPHVFKGGRGGPEVSERRAELVGPDAPDAPGVPGGPGGKGGLHKAAPAPLPSLAIGEAADKAAAAVTGGKVESLRVIAQDGGGSAWLAVVLGPDGVRHAVTVSGTDGTITGNTVVGSR